MDLRKRKRKQKHSNQRGIPQEAGKTTMESSKTKFMDARGKYFYQFSVGKQFEEKISEKNCSDRESFLVRGPIMSNYVPKSQPLIGRKHGILFCLPTCRPDQNSDYCLAYWRKMMRSDVIEIGQLLLWLPRQNITGDMHLNICSC